MTTFIDALRRKYEYLSECCIFESFAQKSPNRVGANILFPSRSLSMDCQQISSIGNEEELFCAAGHVAELDLAGNKLTSWNEVFTLLRCLRNLESLNLSQNPLNPDAVTNTASGQAIPDRFPQITDENDENRATIENSNAIEFSSFRNHCSPSSSPILRFACFEPIESTECNGIQLSEKADYCNGDSLFDSSERRMTGVLGDSAGIRVSFLKKRVPPVQLAIDSGLLSSTTVFPKLTVLALNSTFVPWKWVLGLIHLFPNLTTLHVALNNYGSDEECLEGAGDSFDPDPTASVFHGLRTLYFSDNGVSSWWTVCRLGRQFPSLEHLVLLGNPLAHIPAPLPANNNLPGLRLHEKLPEPEGLNNLKYVTKAQTRPFGNLHTLGLSETLISRWESIDALGEWMPKLNNLRLGNTLPVFQSWHEPDCRAHVIARLPRLTTYNRSVIDSEERETAERGFVRHYGQVEPALRPNRYWELERRYGRLEPLADIDLSPKRFIRVRVALDGKEAVYELNMNLKVSQVKRQFLQLFDVDPAESRLYKLFYFDQYVSQIPVPEELKFPSRAIYSYKPEFGDLFELIRVPEHKRHH